MAWRDLRFAKGRFALMGAVVVLIALLVGLVSGLTAGLARNGTSAITGLPADRIAFSAPADGGSPSFTNSEVGERTWQQWANVPGVRDAEPLGIARSRAQTEAGGHSLTTFGVAPGSGLAPANGLDDGDPATVVLSEPAAEELELAAGDTFRLAGREVRVGAVRGDAMYSQTPVVWTSLDTWQRVAGKAEGESAEGGRELAATVVALRGGADSGALAAADERLGTETVAVDDSVSAIDSHTAMNSSLQLMLAFLFLISSLVIGAFFTVWTIQRAGDIAVLKALGASTRYVLRDALGQVAALLLLGTGVGTALAVLAGAAVRDVVPFELNVGVLLVPALVMAVLGLAGAALSVRRITSVDPLIALGSAR